MTSLSDKLKALTPGCHLLHGIGCDSEEKSLRSLVSYVNRVHFKRSGMKLTCNRSEMAGVIKVTLNKLVSEC